MENLVYIIDFWFWTLVPAIMLIGVIVAIPSALIIGMMMTGRAKEQPRAPRTTK